MQHQIHQMNLVQPQRTPHFQPGATIPEMPPQQAPREPVVSLYQNQQYPTQPIQWQPMQQPAQQRQRRGGRNCGPRSAQQPQVNPFQFLPNGQFGPAQTQQSRQQQLPSKIKKALNWNYCWTHGHDVGNDHTSATCIFLAPGHNYQATKTNTMGGSDRCIERTQMTPRQQPGNGNFGNYQAPGYAPF